MILRLLFLISVFCGLAAGPVRAAFVCEEEVCMNCCSGEDMKCCGSDAGKLPVTPAAILAGTGILKDMVVPVLFCIGIQPEMVIPPAAVQDRVFARRPVQPRVDVTCIRLI